MMKYSKITLLVLLFFLEILKKKEKKKSSAKQKQKQLKNDQLTGHFQSFFFSSARP